MTIDDKKPPTSDHGTDKKAEEVADLPARDTSSKDAENVKGGRAWDIPAGTASPSA